MTGHKTTDTYQGQLWSNKIQNFIVKRGTVLCELIIQENWKSTYCRKVIVFHFQNEYKIWKKRENWTWKTLNFSKNLEIL